MVTDAYLAQMPSFFAMFHKVRCSPVERYMMPYLFSKKKDVLPHTKTALPRLSELGVVLFASGFADSRSGFAGLIELL